MELVLEWIRWSRWFRVDLECLDSFTPFGRESTSLRSVGVLWVYWVDFFRSIGITGVFGDLRVSLRYSESLGESLRIQEYE